MADDWLDGGRLWGKVQECKADSQQSIRELFVLSLLSPVNFDYHVSRCIIIIVVVVLPLVIYLPYPTQQHQQQRPECRSCSNGGGGVSSGRVLNEWGSSSSVALENNLLIQMFLLAFIFVSLNSL